jgi:hypothetical protein
MRIAICFSGQIRTGVEAAPNLLEYIGDLLPYTDFFVHTWDINTKKNYNGCRIRGREQYDISDKLNKFSNIYNPKKMVIENLNTITLYGNETFKNKKLLKMIPPMWYSFYKSIEYKTRYELINGFKYDYVVKLRPDIILPKIRKLKNEIRMGVGDFENKVYIENTPIEFDESNHWCDDVFFISKSSTMDILANYYLELKKEEYIMNNEYPLNYGFAYHLKKHNIEYQLNVEIPKLYEKLYTYTIYRDECLHLSPTNDFIKCKECDDYYYGMDGTNPLSDKFFINDLIREYYVEENICDTNNPKFYYIDELLKREKEKII